MNKQALTFGIVLAIGTMGCAGFGLQQGSSLSAQLEQTQGLDKLWSSAVRVSAQGLEAPLYGEQELGDLWNHSEQAAISAGETEFAEQGALRSLRLSATVPSKILAQ
jgi:hypothetical protein